MVFQHCMDSVHLAVHSFKSHSQIHFHAISFDISSWLWIKQKFLINNAWPALWKFDCIFSLQTGHFARSMRLCSPGLASQLDGFPNSYISQDICKKLWNSCNFQPFWTVWGILLLMVSNIWDIALWISCLFWLLQHWNGSPHLYQAWNKSIISSMYSTSLAGINSHFLHVPSQYHCFLLLHHYYHYHSPDCHFYQHHIHYHLHLNHLLLQNYCHHWT